MPSTPSNGLLSILRDRLGVPRLSDVRWGSGADSEVQHAIADSYSDWAQSFTEPPPRPAHTLRPIVLPLTGMNPFDEAATAAQTLLACHSVCVHIPDTMSFLRRLWRFLVLLEEEIDSGLVV